LLNWKNPTLQIPQELNNPHKEGGERAPKAPRRVFFMVVKGSKERERGGVRKYLSPKIS
jgi:hypothetical protein